MAKKKAPKFISETEMKIKTACKSAIEQMQAKVLAHYKKHPDSAFSGHYLVELEKTVKAVYKDLGLSVGKSFKTGIKKGMEDFYNKAAEDLKTHGTYNHILGKPNVELVKHYLNSSFEEVAMHTTKMSFEHVKALRQMSAEILRTASLTGASRADVTKQFLERAEEIPGFQFVAANGAVWKNETYFRMLARTELMNAARAAYDDKCAKEGCDVVELTYSGDSCDHCTSFEGTQFSLTGATKGMPTKQDLIDAGVFHPNCTHSYTAVPNWDIPDDIEDEAPKKDDAEQPQEKPQDVKPSKVAKPKKTVEPSEAKPKKAPKAKKTAEANPSDQTQNAPSPTAVIKPKKTTKKQTTDNPAPSPVPAPVAPEVKPSEVKKPEPKPEPKPEVKPADEAKPEKKQKPSDKPEVKPEPKKDADGFPKNPDDLKVVDDSPGGTTGAKIVEDEDGKKYVMKKNGKTSAEHVESEAAVDNFYLKMGIRVPRCKLYRDENGNVVKLSEYLENARRLGDWWSSASASERREMLKKLRSGFDIDVLLGNWDVIGDAIDNILIDKDGNPWRIDNGGSAQFRAQGAKKLDDQWKTGFVDDLWSMRETGTKKQFFGDIDTVDLLNSIVNRDYSEALKELPDDMRAVVEKRLNEFKELAERGNDFVATSKYTPQSIDKVLRYSHDLSKEDMRERIPDKIEPNGYGHTVQDFGWFRSGSSSSNQTNEQQKDANIQKTIVDAAKTINYHNGAKSGNSDAGDHKPNQAKIDAAIALKPELEKLAKQGNSGAKYYLDRIAKIEEAAKNNTTLSGKNVSVDVPIYTAQQTQTGKNVAQNAPKSFTCQIHDYISQQSVEYNGKKIPLDPMFISRAQSDQSGNSFNEDACKIKIVRLNAMGIDPKNAGKTYFTGYDQMQKTNWKNAVDYYKNNPSLLARDTETYLRYQAGVQLMLEKTDFPGNDRATRTVILVRNEHDKVVANSEVGDELKAKHGVNESHATFRTVSLGSERRNCTVTRVPYSRISGFYFAEQYPGQGGCGFLDDDENEFTADTSGLKTLFVEKDVGSGRDTEPFFDTYLKWEKGGYKKLTK